MKKEALRVSTTIPAAPTTLYLAWLSSEQHGAMTDGSAKIDPDVGGKFSACDGYVTGKLVTLDLGRRLIMSWRTTDFPREHPDSRVEAHFEALGGSTRLTILHTDIPAGLGERCRDFWNERYFGPMRAFFSKYLPDPRKPPPPRPPPPPIDDEDEEAEETREDVRRRKGKPAVKPAPATHAAKPASAKPAVSRVAAKPPAAKKAAKAPAKTASKPTTKKAVKAPAKKVAKPAAKKAAKAPAKKVAKPTAKKAAKAPAKKAAKPTKVKAVSKAPAKSPTTKAHAKKLTAKKAKSKR